METTRPFLYIDLHKSISWREDFHKRDEFGKFRAIKGGSKVVTATGKTGVVEKVTDTHYHIRTADGKIGKVVKTNVIHAEDHAKVMEAQKKAKRKKASSAKGVATKVVNKTNANVKGKAVVEPKIVAPTIKVGTGGIIKRKDLKAKVAPIITPVVAPVVGNDVSQNSRESVKNATHTTVVPHGKTKIDPEKDAQNVALKEFDSMDEDRDKTKDIDTLWQSKSVQRLMKKPPEKRSEADIRLLAGEITTANDKLARYTTLQMGKSRGLNLLMQTNKIGDVGESGNGAVIVQETGYYGDLLQASRASMYETLYRVMKGSQNPDKDTSMGTHVITRMKQKLHSDIYDLMNEVPAPHEIRTAIGDMAKAKKELQQTLGREPNKSELAVELQNSSKHFREAPIMDAPSYDEKTAKWVASKKRIEDPEERLRMLDIYSSQQKSTSLDADHATNFDNGETEEVTMNSALIDAQLTPDVAYEKKIRQAELEEAIPQALTDMGFTENERLVFTTMYGSPSGTTKKTNMTMPEVAEAINANGGIDGKKVDDKTIYNIVRQAMKKLQLARDTNHPAIKKLSLLKSLFFNILMKALYEYDLVKSLSGWGVGMDVLEMKYTRNATASNLLSLQKSLAPYEYVGALVTTEDGGIHARIIEFSLPENNELYKSFNASMNSLKKSMFPHKGKSNHEVNTKAQDYIKANSKKYHAVSSTQQASARAKKGELTWSEKLLLEHEGSAWITWGGKRILIDVGDGKILYDSSNEAHREEHNKGTSEDKIDFHHEKEELDRTEEERGKKSESGWKEHLAMKQRNATKKKPLDEEAEKADWMKKNKGVSFDEEGNHKFEADTEVSEDNKHSIDHGIQAFKEQMEDMKKEWNGESALKTKVKDENAHKTNHAYTALNEAQRKEVDDAQDKGYILGKHMLSTHGEALTDAIHELRDSDDPEAVSNFKDAVSALGKNKSNGMVTAKSMISLGNKIKKLDDVDSEESKAFIARELGNAEISMGRNASNKKMLPEGTMMVGNPITGKTMVVKIKHGWGEGNKSGWTSMIDEAFDPEGGNHEDINSWGELSRALGMNDTQLQETLAQHANETEERPFMKQIGEDEYNAMRANTKVGLSEAMTHKDFKLVKESIDKNGKMSSRTYAQDMPDGTQNTFMVNAKGYITDPVMARLISQRKPIENVKDLHEALKNAVGNRAWVTTHVGSDINVGDALGHHVQLEYDGKGAPRVIGGTYDGYRFMDSNTIPKDAIDPATGDPIKALFKNGKLVDRRFTTKNDIPMKEGKAVLYPDGDKFHKGKINSIEGDTYKVTDGKGHVIGMFKKSELKPASEEGKTNSKSGQAVVRVAQTGVHRMDTKDNFTSLDAKDQKKLDKAKELFKQALKQAGIHKAFDSEDNLNDKLELSDANMRELKKRLGRSKAGKEMLAKFQSAYTKDLQIHVPDNLKAKIEAEGVTVGANGTAKISVGKFEQLRDILGGLSLDNNARKYLEEHFNRKDRIPMEERMPEIIKNYQPSAVDTSTEFGKAYQAQFKKDSFLMDKNTGLYGTQLQGIAHLIERGRGIVGHGMGVGKTIEGVASAMHYKATMIANGQKPKKTLVVCPAGIQSDWGKEISTHTNSKALYIGSEGKMKKRDADGNFIKAENGRHKFGQDGTEQEAMGNKKFMKNMDSIGAEDHDFHIMSYDQFMKMKHELTSSGMYDNIIIDEIHAFKNQSGQRGKSLAETTDSFKNVWGLSGTPMENDAREVYSLIDTITGGRHELGNPKEFAEKFLMKDKNGKIIGVKGDPNDSSSPAGKLGDILANVVQFRGGEDVTFTNGDKVQFPKLIGKTSEADPNPQTDFMGDMVDKNRDHNTTDYYGTKHSVFDYENGKHDVVGKDGGTYSVNTTAPAHLTDSQKKFYSDYQELQAKHLSPTKLSEMVKASATGYDNSTRGKNSNGNYLTAMQKLQKYLNAPQAKDMYVGEGASALDSDLTGEQAVPKAGGAKSKATGLKPYNPVTGEGHYKVDSDGHKRYFKSDGEGGYKRNKDGSPELMEPMHHNNPKAEYLKKRATQYLDSLEKENAQRVKDGRPELMPKMVVKSSYTTFGTDIADNVLRDLQKEHPHLAYWKDKLEKEGKSLSTGQFTGEADDRESTKTGFRGNKDAYDKDQGNLWATTVSPAGKEGVDFGNAHLMLMYDQDWNPQRMAQFTARVRRSDSGKKAHEQMGRDNSVRVESLHMPGTVEDFMFNAEDSKMGDIQKVTTATRQAEQSPRYGDSEAGISSSKNFTRSQKNRAGAKAKDTKVIGKTKKPTMGAGADMQSEQEVASTKEKSIKLVIML